MATKKVQLNLDHRVVFNVDSETLDAIDNAARRGRTTPSAWIRAAVYDQLGEQTPPPAPVRERQAEHAA